MKNKNKSYWEMMLGNVFRVQGTFPNMESMVMLNEKSSKIRKNYKTKEGWCSLLVMMFAVLFSGSSMHFQT